jgi:hypothetical protein
MFIGSFVDKTTKNREWVIEFAKKHFTLNSVFINTNADEFGKQLVHLTYRKLDMKQLVLESHVRTQQINKEKSFIEK